MAWIKSFFIALATYSAVPVPIFDWDEDSMGYSFCFLPFVGVMIALALFLWTLFCGRFIPRSELVLSAGCMLIPLLISGGIHMDGFCDTADALAAHMPPGRCLEIMKDPHAGAFAIIYCGMYLLASCAVYGSLLQTGSLLSGAFILGGVFVLSRAVSVLSVTGHKKARSGGMLATFARPAHLKTVRISAWLWILAVWAGEIFLLRKNLYVALCVVSASVVTLCGVYIWYHRLAERRFGGITGDTSGFFVQMSELILAFVLCCVMGLF